MTYYSEKRPLKILSIIYPLLNQGIPSITLVSLLSIPSITLVYFLSKLSINTKYTKVILGMLTKDTRVILGIPWFNKG